MRKQWITIAHSTMEWMTFGRVKEQCAYINEYSVYKTTEYVM